VCLFVSKFSFWIHLTNIGANLHYAMITESNPLALNLFKFQIKWRKDEQMWRERHCSNLHSDFEISIYKNIFIKYEHLLKLI